jgi:integrase
MAGRKNEPWYWNARKEWCVKIKGVRHRLGPTKDEAYRQFYLLMAGEPPEPKQPERPWLFASEVADEFQVYLQAERSKATHDWYCQYLDPFKERFMMERAETLTANVVRNWVNEKWKSQPSRRAAQRAIKAAFRKAVNDGRLPYSAVAAMSLPAETARDHVVTRKAYQGVLEAIKDTTFTDLIQFVWLTGARPQEALIAEWEHVEVKNSRIVLPPPKSKGKKKPRVIYLSPEALTLVKTKKGEGKLFKRQNGKPYEKDYVRQLFRKLEPTLSFRYCLYHFRHGFAHRSLAAGNDAMTVATLLGHGSTQTLSRVYAHLNQADGHLRDALKKTK